MTFTPKDCANIRNIAVGRSALRLRLFLTCTQKKTGATILKIFEKPEEMAFEEADFHQEIEKDSQPFVTDLNGDFIDDILFNDVDKQIKVAYQTKDGKSFVVMPFAQSMLVAEGQQSTEGCLTIDHTSKIMTSPHSTTLVDLDGDCISDLFMTVQDKKTGE